jgi:hypothetical protein
VSNVSEITVEVRTALADDVAKWRKALFETGTMQFDERQKRMVGGPFADLYNWLAGTEDVFTRSDLHAAH